MGRVLVALVLLAGLVSGARAEGLSPRTFAERVMAAMKAAVPDATVRVTEQNDVFVRAPNGMQAVMGLADSYARYKRDPATLDNILQMHTLALVFRSKGNRATASAEMLSTRAFAERMARALRAAYPSATVSVNAQDEVELRADGRSLTLIMTNAYGMYRREPNRLDEVIGLYVAGTQERTKASTAAKTAAGLDRARIVPVVKDRQWLDDNVRGLKARGLAAEFLTEDLNKELVIVYAEDSENRTRYLMAAEDVGDRKQLRALAVKNLMRLLPKAEMRNLGDVTIISAGGDYEASLLLFEHLWTGGKINGQIEVKGDIVVAVPAKDVLLVTGSRSRKGLKAVREIVAKEVQGPHRLTDTLFVYRDGRFQRFGRPSRAASGKE